MFRALLGEKQDQLVCKLFVQLILHFICVTEKSDFVKIHIIINYYH